MMIYEVIITEQANADLRSIYEYIAFELLSPDKAAQLDRLEKKIISLETFSENIESMKKNHGKAEDFVIMPVDNFLVLYIPDKDTKIVTVIRVVYKGRNVDNQLERHTKLEANRSKVSVK